MQPFLGLAPSRTREERARVEGDIPWYRTTSKGGEALRCFREIEELMPELKAGWGRRRCCYYSP
ncbi:Uncharacterised protein [uncultured archaeon]|nr:Uncharacterised protein [uncultured archaeon]